METTQTPIAGSLDPQDPSKIKTPDDVLLEMAGETKETAGIEEEEDNLRKLPSTYHLATDLELVQVNSHLWMLQGTLVSVSREELEAINYAKNDAAMKSARMALCKQVRKALDAAKNLKPAPIELEGIPSDLRQGLKKVQSTSFTEKDAQAQQIFSDCKTAFAKHNATGMTLVMTAHDLLFCGHQTKDYNPYTLAAVLRHAASILEKRGGITRLDLNDYTDKI